MVVGRKIAETIRTSVLIMYLLDLVIKASIIKYMFSLSIKHILDNEIKKLRLHFHQKCGNLTSYK